MFRRLTILFCLTPFVSIASAQAGKLDKLDWMSGHWSAEGESHVEEVWTAPRAGTMTGMFRLVNGDEARVMEYIVISEEKGKIHYRFKHFEADYGTWEADAPPLTFRLVESKKGRAVFRNTQKSGNQPAYISYLLGKDGRMTVMVGHAPGKADEGETIKFVLNRQ